jgi:hypothetical protein
MSYERINEMVITLDILGLVLVFLAGYWMHIALTERDTIKSIVTFIFALSMVIIALINGA